MERIICYNAPDCSAFIPGNDDINGRIADPVLYAAVSPDTLFCSAYTGSESNFGRKGGPFGFYRYRNDPVNQRGEINRINIVAVSGCGFKFRVTCRPRSGMSV